MSEDQMVETMLIWGNNVVALINGLYGGLPQDIVCAIAVGKTLELYDFSFYYNSSTIFYVN